MRARNGVGAPQARNQGSSWRACLPLPALRVCEGASLPGANPAGGLLARTLRSPGAGEEGEAEKGQVTSSSSPADTRGAWHLTPDLCDVNTHTFQACGPGSLGQNAGPWTMSSESPGPLSGADRRTWGSGWASGPFSLLGTPTSLWSLQCLAPPVVTLPWTCLLPWVSPEEGQPRGVPVCSGVPTQGLAPCFNFC